MTEVVDSKDLIPYNVMVNFQDVMEGNSFILAKSPEHAKELATKMFAHRQNLEIIEVQDISGLVDMKNMFRNPATEGSIN